MERELQMKPQINDGGPAFPMTGEGCHNPLYSQPGMTLRDYFAGQALAGMAVAQRHRQRVGRIGPQRAISHTGRIFSDHIARHRALPKAIPPQGASHS